MTFGERLRICRTNAGLKQAELGKLVNKSGQVISNWERGYTSAVTSEDLQELAKVLRVEVSELVPSPSGMHHQADTYRTTVDRLMGRGNAHEAVKMTEEMEIIKLYRSLCKRDKAFAKEMLQRMQPAKPSGKMAAAV